MSAKAAYDAAYADELKKWENGLLVANDSGYAVAATGAVLALASLF